MSNNEYIQGAIEENKIMLQAFEDKLNGGEATQIITQPMTYFKNRIAELEAKLTSQKVSDE